MAGKIFISYRRGDEAGFTQALYQRLEDEFGARDLFMDVAGHIMPGDDFIEVLNNQVAAADVVLVVIGPRWTELLHKRQDGPHDFVTTEIQAALEQGKRVIPVLVGDAEMPSAERLPETIRRLARRHAVALRPDRFSDDCQGFIAALKEGTAKTEQRSAANKRFTLDEVPNLLLLLPISVGVGFAISYLMFKVRVTNQGLESFASALIVSVVLFGYFVYRRYKR